MINKSVSSKRKRIISTLMSTYNSDNGNGRFYLKNNCESFTGRLNSTFEGLSALEERHEEWQKKHSLFDSFQESDPLITDDIDVNSSRNTGLGTGTRKRKLFKDKLPNYKKYPDKWIRYSLADVSPHHMSERSNKHAAMTFLKELRENRFLPIEDIHMDSDSKPIFQKPGQSACNIKSQVDDKSRNICSCFHSSKTVMPEYKFGMKNVKSAKPKVQKSLYETETSVRLDHLSYADEQETPDDETS